MLHAISTFLNQFIGGIRRITRGHMKLAVSTMTMLCLVLSLFASHLFLMTPSVIGKDHFQNIEGCQSSEMKKIVSGTTTPRTSPFLLTINRNKIMKESKAHEEVSSPQNSQAKSPNSQAEVQSRGSASGKINGDIPPEMAEHAGDACRKVDMMIQAADLGLSPKFIKPESFNAYQCRGKCPLTQRKTFVNHSLMKVLVKNGNGIKTDGEACCVPTKLRPMSFIYYVEERESFVMRTYQDMIVEECGCH